MSVWLRFSLGILLSLSFLSPASALVKRTPSGPIVCKGNQNLVLRAMIVRGRRVAVRARGNCDLTIVNSVLIGGKMGLQVIGNASVKIRNSFIRGQRYSMVLGGNATVRDRGYNQFRGKIRRVGQNVTFRLSRNSQVLKAKKIRNRRGMPPAGTVPGTATTPPHQGTGTTPPHQGTPPHLGAPSQAVAPPSNSNSGSSIASSFSNTRVPRGLKRSGVINCVGSQEIVLRKRFIRTSKTGIVLMGSCRLLLVDSWISAKFYGIRVMGSGEVTILRSFVRGRKAAIQIIGSSTISAKNSKLVGGLSRIGTGTFKNRGGNILR